jgi:hypothetical protein
MYLQDAKVRSVDTEMFYYLLDAVKNFIHANMADRLNPDLQRHFAKTSA